jgi:hypothetical protein
MWETILALAVQQVVNFSCRKVLKVRWLFDSRLLVTNVTARSFTMLDKMEAIYINDSRS